MAESTTTATVTDKVIQSGVPYDSNPIWFNIKEPEDLFTGRHRELEDLHNKIHRELTIPQTIAITGLGGIGKTQLARKYVQDHSKEYYDVLWFDAENEDMLKYEITSLAADRLNIKTKNANNQNKDFNWVVEEMYGEIVNRMASSQTQKSLVIFDNVENIDCLHFVLLFLPQGIIKPHILITTRLQDWEYGIETIEVFHLNELHFQDAVTLVKFGLKCVKVNESEVNELVETLQQLPLALHQAIGYIKKQNAKGIFKISDCLKIYMNNPKELLDSSDYPETTFTTWKKTIEKIASCSHGKLALDILNIMAYFARDKIECEIFLKLADSKSQLKSAITLLIKYSMVKGDQSTLYIHSVVQDVMRLECKENEEEVIGKAFYLLYICNPKLDVINHATSVMKYASKYSTLINDILKSQPGSDKFIPLHLLSRSCHFVSSAGNLEILKYFIERGAKIDKECLDIALLNGHLEIVKCLIQEGVKIDISSAVKTVIIKGYIDIVKYLIDEDINNRNFENYLLYACEYGHLEIVKYLIEKGTIFYGVPAIDYAARNGHLEIIKYLDGKCALMNYSETIYCISSLHIVCKLGKLEAVKYLLENGAKIDMKYNGETPLYIASYNGNLNVVEYLVENKADINSDNEGKTPLDAAYDRCILYFNDDVVNYLKKNGAKRNRIYTS